MLNVQEIARSYLQHCNMSATLHRVAVLRRSKSCNATQRKPIGTLHVAVDRGLLRSQFAVSCNFEERPGMTKTIALNEHGRRVGESHPRAKLLDREVHLALELLDAGLSYAQVALKFDVSKSCIAHIATGRRRGQLVDRLVRVSVSR